MLVLFVMVVLVEVDEIGYGRNVLIYNGSVNCVGLVCVLVVLAVVLFVHCVDDSSGCGGC